MILTVIPFREEWNYPYCDFFSEEWNDPYCDICLEADVNGDYTNATQPS